MSRILYENFTTDGLKDLLKGKEKLTEEKMRISDELAKEKSENDQNITELVVDMAIIRKILNEREVNKCINFI